MEANARQFSGWFVCRKHGHKGLECPQCKAEASRELTAPAASPNAKEISTREEDYAGLSVDDLLTLQLGMSIAYEMTGASELRAVLHKITNIIIGKRQQR